MALRRALASLVPKLAQPVPELVAPFAVQACKLPMGVMTEEQQQRPQAPMFPFSRSECSMHLGEVAAQPLSGGSTTAAALCSTACAPGPQHPWHLCARTGFASDAVQTVKTDIVSASEISMSPTNKIT